MLLPVGMLLFTYMAINAIDSLDWADIRNALARLEGRQIAAGLALTFVTYAAASCYELVSRAQERHALPAASCLAIGFVCYSIAGNLSSLLGNWGTRYRLYARRGFNFRQTTRIAVLSIGANWSGFVLLAGLVFLLMPPDLPKQWPIDSVWLRAGGTLLLIAAISYLVWCWRAAGRTWQLRGMRFTVPRLGIACMQLGLSALVWAGIGSVVTQFLPAQAQLVSVLAVLFLSTVAGLMIRVPAGVGVTEVVFVAILGPALGTSAVVAALLAYRAFFQLLPVILAALLYLLLELQGKNAWSRNQQKATARAGNASLTDSAKTPIQFQ